MFVKQGKLQNNPVFKHQNWLFYFVNQRPSFQIMTFNNASLLIVVLIDGLQHRRRIYTEEKAKVVAAV